MQQNNINYVLRFFNPLYKYSSLETHENSKWALIFVLKVMLGDFQLISGPLMTLNSLNDAENLSRTEKVISWWTCTQEGIFKKLRGIFSRFTYKSWNDHFSIQLYDKTDDFPFPVVRMSFLRCNYNNKKVTSETFYGHNLIFFWD